MAEKDFEPDDPMELVGMVVADADDERAMDEMARTFVDEFVRMGWALDDMLAVFMDPFYRGPHSIYRAKGLGYVTATIEEVMAKRARAEQSCGED